jgi:hypothetical protein
VALFCSKQELWLLAISSETTFVSSPRLGNHVPIVKDKHATIQILVETVFSTPSVQRGYKEDCCGNRVGSVRESVKKRGSLKGTNVQTGLERVKVKNLHC